MVISDHPWGPIVSLLILLYLHTSQDLLYFFSEISLPNICTHKVMTAKAVGPFSDMAVSRLETPQHQQTKSIVVERQRNRWVSSSLPLNNPIAMTWWLNRYRNGWYRLKEASLPECDTLVWCKLASWSIVRGAVSESPELFGPWAVMIRINQERVLSDGEENAFDEFVA